MNYATFFHEPQLNLEVAGLEVAPYGRGSGLQVTPILKETEQKTVEWSEPILDNNEFGWSDNKQMWSDQKAGVLHQNDVWSSPKVIQ